MVSVIDNAVENFGMEQVANADILAQMGKSDKRRDDCYKTSASKKVEEALEKTTTAFSNLITTRVNKLEVPLKEIGSSSREGTICEY